MIDMTQLTQDIIPELSKAGIKGETMEALTMRLAEPDAYLSEGEMARLGAAFAVIGKILTDAAKVKVEDRVVGGVGKDGEHQDNAVSFKWRRGGESLRVNAKEVKSTFPPEEYGELYSKYQTRDSIAITLPPQLRTR